jgi:pyruvate formate lyase activating enzyme
MNIDLKSMDPAFYRKICGGNLDPVLATIRTAAKMTHVELTTLLYTGHNDADDQVRKVVDFVAETDGKIPLHISRYFPQHRATAPPTTPDRLAAAYRIARERLQYVYVGNMHLAGAEDTACPECHATVIRREGYRVDARGLSGDRCAACSARLRFVA